MMNSIKAQCKAEILRTLRNRRFIIFSMLMPIIFYFIFTSTVGDNMQVQGIEWKAYYLMSMTAFGIIGTNLITMGVRFAQERAQGWTRLLRIAPLRSSVYLLSKMISQSILNLSTIVIMFTVGGLAKGIELTPAQWLLCGLWLWIGALPFMALGTLIGTLKSAEVVQVIANILYMGLAVLGGLWMPITIMPSFIQQLAKFLPSYRYAQGAWNILSGHAVSWAGFAILAAYILLFMLLSTYILRRQEAI